MLSKGDFAAGWATPFGCFGNKESEAGKRALAFPLAVVDREGSVRQLSCAEVRYSNYNWGAAGGLAARRQGMVDNL